jgi:hypothetical protein
MLKAKRGPNLERTRGGVCVVVDILYLRSGGGRLSPVVVVMDGVGW